jgi:uncharacterized membrane protein
MKNIQGIFSNKIANLTFLPRPLRLPYAYVDESTYETHSLTVWLAFLQKLESFLVTAYFPKRSSCALFKKAL